MRVNFAKAEQYCLINKFTHENVGEFLDKIKDAETYSELVRCLKHIDKVPMFDCFKIKDNKDDYKKMNLSDLRKYVMDNNMDIDVSKMKKPEILKAIELKMMELKETIPILEESSETVVSEIL